MKPILFLLFILTFIVADSNASEIQQIKQLSEKIFTTQSNEKYMTNLLLKYNEILLKSKLYFIKNRKETTIATQQSELILQQDYWQMYKKKLSPILRFNLTPQIITAIKSNFTFLQITVYVIIKQSKHQIDKQTTPLLNNFSHTVNQGIQNWMIADQSLIEKQPQSQMVLSHADLYFFQFDWQLPFSTKNNQKTQSYGIFTDTQASYYYPRPLSKEITTKLKQNYIPLSKLKQGESFNLKINIKLAGYLYPLFLYVKQRQQLFPESPLYQFKDIDENMFDHRVMVFWPFLYRFVKNVILQGSIISWLIFIWSGIAVLCSTSVAILSFLFQYRIFKFAEEYRGMSLYGLLLAIALNLVIIMAGFLSDSKDHVTLAFFMMLFTCWKVTKMASVQFSLGTPFIKVNGLAWYKSYQQKDWSIFIKTLPFIVGFITLVTLYPLLFQNYLDQMGINWMDEVRNYLLERLINVIDKYVLIFTLVIQIVLNYQLKSCNSMTWKLIICLVVYFSVDNSMVLITPSFADLLFWLKQDIFLWIIIAQKLLYGNNLDNMKIPDNVQNMKVPNNIQNQFSSNQQNQNQNRQHLNQEKQKQNLIQKENEVQQQKPSSQNHQNQVVQIQRQLQPQSNHVENLPDKQKTQ